MLMPRWLKILLRIIIALVVLVVLLVGGISLYITYQKDRFLKLVNTELNKNIDGTVIIGDLHSQFFKGFPNIALGLDDVILRDKRFPQHHHTLLDAKNFDVSVDISDLLKGNININHVDISNASIDLYTDSTGYSNTSLFKKKSAQKSSSKSSSATQLKKFSLTNVDFKVENEKAKKLYDFVVNDLHGDMNYPDTGWHAGFHLDVTAKSMAFRLSHGSFIKNKAIEGDFNAGFNEKTGKINVIANGLDIGDDPFDINALFDTSKPGTDFTFHITANKLLWRHASALLSNNIAIKLNMFDISNPLAVKAIISGNFDGGDPYLYITAKISNSTVTIPGSQLDNCTFDGVFTNNYQNGKGYTDENSVIRLTRMTGSYENIPFKIDTGSIINLDNPIATGNFNSNFPIADLNTLAGDKIAKFGNGTAAVKFRYKADIVNYRINKPTVTGSISIKNADIYHIAGDLSLKNTSLNLNFIGNDLILSNFRIQTGHSVVTLDGRVKNFLNLYYNAPEKILLTLDIRSPQMYLGEFIGFLNGGDNSPAPAHTANSGNVVTQLNNVFRKGNMELHLRVNNLHYNKFLATDVQANLLTSHNSLALQDVSLKSSGGTLRLNGDIQKSAGVNKVNLTTVISNVDVRDFFTSFNNFGLKDFTAENLSGSLSAKTQITAAISNKAVILPKSINGNLDVSLRNGALLNFKPLVGVGKYAFPFRDLKHITIPKLDAHFLVQGDKIQISPMQISSSVLNVDLAGTYGLTNGTDITLDIPLRNPKGDSTITDKTELNKKRYKGIVLHLRAKADETGKIKIGLNKEKKDSDK